MIVRIKIIVLVFFRGSSVAPHLSVRMRTSAPPSWPRSRCCPTTSRSRFRRPMRTEPTYPAAPRPHTPRTPRLTGATRLRIPEPTGRANPGRRRPPDQGGGATCCFGFTRKRSVSDEWSHGTWRPSVSEMTSFRTRCMTQLACSWKRKLTTQPSRYVAGNTNLLHNRAGM